MTMWHLVEAAGWTVQCRGLYCPLRFRQMLQNCLDNEPKHIAGVSWGNWIFFNGQVSHLISTQKGSSSVIKYKTECRDSQTSSNWRWLQQKPGLTRTYRDKRVTVETDHSHTTVTWLYLHISTLEVYLLPPCVCTQCTCACPVLEKISVKLHNT